MFLILYEQICYGKSLAGELLPVKFIRKYVQKKRRREFA
jgi:hypothetical protein